MRKAAREVTDTELSLLNELWQRPSATVQELTEILYGNTTLPLLATVRKLLDRLEAKGCISRDRTRWPYHYSAILKREELACNRLQAAADELFDGDLTPLLTQLVRSQRLTAKDRENLRKVLAELDRENPKKGK
jgi:BlaI family transcriptional regulator, penicillinase repressor